MSSNRSYHWILKSFSIMGGGGGTGFLWWTLGLSIPLLAVGFFRIPMGDTSVPAAVVVILFSGVYAFIQKALRPESLTEKINPFTMLVLIALTGFVFWHLAGTIRSDDLQLAVSEHYKLSLGILCFIFMIGLSSKLLVRYDALWVLHFTVASILLLALIYRYALVFRMPFLGNDWDLPTRLGKNQLGWFLAVTMPYLVAFFFGHPSGKRMVIPLQIHGVAWLYVASRGSWLCGLLGIMLALFSARRYISPSRFLGRSIMAILSLMLFGFLFGLLFENPVDQKTLELVSRLPTGDVSMTADTSTQTRLELIERHLHLFSQNPFFGQGLMNSLRGQERLSHNDYLFLLADTGLFGLSAFIFSIAAITFTVWRIPASRWYYAGARGSLFAAIIYFAFINVYTSPMFWILAGLAVLPALKSCSDVGVCKG